MTAALAGRPTVAAMMTAHRPLLLQRRRLPPPPPPRRASSFARPPHAAAASGSGPSDASSTTSFPPYEVVSKTPDYDLRLYAPHFAVECDYARRDEGFEKVASYAAGANEAGARFAESQPVVMHYPPGTAKVAAAVAAAEATGSQEPKIMSLHIGPRLSKKAKSSSSSSSESESAETPPLPTREGVRLAARGGELVAAARVPAQYATPDAALAAVEALSAALRRVGLRLHSERDARGAFRLAQYGALFQLEERVNEVQLRVEL